MDKKEISSAIDSSFDSTFKNWTKQIERELYPSAFVDEYSWLRVKNALSINNNYLKTALKEALSELLSD